MKMEEFINDNYKTKNKFATNYFFISSLIVVVSCILIYTAKIDFQKYIGMDGYSHWMDVLYFNRIALSFLNSFGHLTLQHCLLNMLSFSVCGLYLERKIGSIKLLLLVLALALFTSTAITANNMSLNWRGFSGVNYALYFYIIVDFLFSLKKTKRNRLNIIIGSIVVALIYVAFCFSGGTTSFSFAAYPYDLITNLGHYTSALIGLSVGFLLQIASLETKKQ